MIDAEIFLEAKLKLIDQWAIFGQLVALSYPIEIGLVFGFWRKEGFGDRDQRGWILEFRFLDPTTAGRC